MQSEESTMAESAAPEASPAPAIQIAPGMFIRCLQVRQSDRYFPGLPVRQSLTLSLSTLIAKFKVLLLLNKWKCSHE